MRLTAVLVLALVMVAGRADAYPQLQLASGSDRCTACHVSPAGGGLLTDFGRSEAGDTVSRGGDGSFLHGLWEPPRWLQLGGDVRGALGVRHLRDRRETLAFPMQADLYLRAGTDALALVVTAGLRGAAREPRPPLVERLASREHYLLWRPTDGVYVRAGRFFPVLGLRLADHTAYVRRYLGLHTLEEPYGLAAGRSWGSWEAHASAFIPSPVPALGSGVPATGAALYVERRIFGETATVAGQTRLALGPDDGRALVGVVGKRWFEQAGLMLMGELDLQRQWFDAGPTRWQLAAYLGARKQLVHGVELGAALQRWQPDLTLRSARDAFELDVQYFPWAHVEVGALLRAAASGSDLDQPGLLGLLQLHYYL